MFRNVLRYRLRIMAAIFATMSFTCSAQEQSGPIRVAIVGLVHDHVAGFLAQLPQHHEVELVGIAEPDSALVAKYEKKNSLAHDLFFPHRKP